MYTSKSSLLAICSLSILTCLLQEDPQQGVHVPPLPQCDHGGLEAERNGLLRVRRPGSRKRPHEQSEAAASPFPRSRFGI